MPLSGDNNSPDIKLATVKDSPQGLPSESVRRINRNIRTLVGVIYDVTSYFSMAVVSVYYD